MVKIKKIYDKVMNPVFSLYNGKVGNIAYYVAFAAVYLLRFYYTTMFYTLFEKPLFLAVPYYVGLLIIAFFSVLSVLNALKVSRKEAVFLAAIILTALLNAFTIKKFDDYLPLLLLVTASRKRDLRPVFFTSIVIGSALLLSAYYASMNGYIPYLVYQDRGNTGMLSHAFGTVYRTALAAHVMYIIMCYAVLRAEKLHLWEYLMFWFDNWLIWRYTWSRSTCACLTGFLILLGALLVYYHIYKKWFCLPRWSALIHIACAAVTYAAIALLYFSKKIPPVAGEDESFKSRFSYSIQAFQKYPLRLFGNVVEERSAVGIPDKSIPYFYLDITYVRVLVIGGIAMFLLFLALMTMASYKCVKNKQVILAVALIMIAIDSIPESHTLNPAMNILILYSTGCLGITKKNGNSCILNTSP